MNRRKEAIISKIMVLSFAFGGFFFLGWSVHGTNQDYPVNVSYINGILTACGILFGIWVLVLGNRPKKGDVSNPIKLRLFRTTVKDFFFFCLLSLVMDVLAIAFTAIDIFSPVITLFMVTMTFGFTALFLSLSVYTYIFWD
jgi:hypothetical protein